ncbi:MAG: type I phosphomannose isomerase catalytic subunit [Pirellulaceae bacterium]
MNPLYPLRFRPLLKRAIWGGRRLSSHLNKPLGDGDDFAESWEIVDHGSDQSVVEYGPLKDVPLRQIMEQHAAALLGQHAGLRSISVVVQVPGLQSFAVVQVHPDDAYAARLTPPDLGKTEAWVVLHAEPEARIYAGLKRGFDRHAFEREVRAGPRNSVSTPLSPKSAIACLSPLARSTRLRQRIGRRGNPAGQ